MSVLRDFAEYFKARKVPIRRWYEDDVGAYAFRVVIDGTTFVCTARKKRLHADRISCFPKIPQIARDHDGYVLMRIKDDMLVFDPVKILANGTDTTNADPKRAKRGEKWVEFDDGWGVPFDEFIDGYAEPPKAAGLDAYK